MLRAVTALALVAVTGCATEGASPPPIEPVAFDGDQPLFQKSLAHRRQAMDFEAAGDGPAALKAYAAALAIQPGHPSILFNMARLAGELGQHDAAADYIAQAADTGLTFNIFRLREALPQETERAADEALARVWANGDAQGRLLPVARATDQDLLVEAVAWRRETGRLFVSSVAKPGVYELYADGGVDRFDRPTDKTASVFAIKLDPTRDILWAATCAAPQTPADARAPTALVGYDLETGDEVARITSPDGRGCVTDFAFHGDDLLIVDSDQNLVFRAQALDAPAELFSAHHDFASLQGAALASGALYVADYALGLFRVDLETGEAIRVESGDQALIGLDGLYAAPGGGLIAIRNGAQPHGAVRIALSETGDAVTGIRPLATGHGVLDDPTLGQVVGDEFIFVANSQWRRFPDNGGPPDESREPTRIVSVFLGE